MINELFQSKQLQRKYIAETKAKYSFSDLIAMSVNTIWRLENTDEFKAAKHILAYNSMPDELNTKSLIDRWKDEKTFYLPVVQGDNMVFRKYTSETKQSDFGIDEPIGEDFADYKSIDLIIVPGLAFDRKLNRLGRGKGYYDKFLKNISVPKLALAFDFQILHELIVDDNDVKMNKIVTQSTIIE